MAGKKRGTKSFCHSVAATIPAKIKRRKSSDNRFCRSVQLPKSTVTAFVDTTPSSVSNPIPTYDCDPSFANSFNLDSLHTDELDNYDGATQIVKETEYGDGYLSIGGFRVYTKGSVESDEFEEREWIDDHIDSSDGFDSDDEFYTSDRDYEIDDLMAEDYVEGVGGSCEILSSVWFENSLEDGDCLEFSDDQDGFGRAAAMEEYISLHGGKDKHHQELISTKHRTRKTRQFVKLKQVTNKKSKSHAQSESRRKMSKRLSLPQSAKNQKKKQSSSHSAPPKLSKSTTRYSDKPVPFISSGTIQADSALQTSTENQVRSKTKNETTTASSSKVGAFELHTTGFGSKMLAKMGFIEGTGLGKDGQGMVRPIESVQRPKSLGLGNQFSEVRSNNDVKEVVVKAAFSKRVGSFEKHTTGFGSKMMVKMGFVAGKGLGKKSQGALRPLKSVRRPKFRGLGGKHNYLNIDQIIK